MGQIVSEFILSCFLDPHTADRCRWENRGATPWEDVLPFRWMMRWCCTRLCSVSLCGKVCWALWGAQTWVRRGSRPHEIYIPYGSVGYAHKYGGERYRRTFVRIQTLTCPSLSAHMQLFHPFLHPSSLFLGHRFQLLSSLCRSPISSQPKTFSLMLLESHFSF